MPIVLVLYFLLFKDVVDLGQPLEQLPGQQQHQRLTVATQETAFYVYFFKKYMSIVIVLYFCFLRMDELEKVEMTLFSALCRNQRGEEAVNAKLQEIDKAEKKAEKKKGEAIAGAGNKGAQAEECREEARARGGAAGESAAAGCEALHPGGLFFFSKTNIFQSYFIFCVRPWRSKLAAAGRVAGRRR